MQPPRGVVVVVHIVNVVVVVVCRPLETPRARIRIHTLVRVSMRATGRVIVRLSLSLFLFPSRSLFLPLPPFPSFSLFRGRAPISASFIFVSSNRIVSPGCVYLSPSLPSLRSAPFASLRVAGALPTPGVPSDFIHPESSPIQGVASRQAKTTRPSLGRDEREKESLNFFFLPLHHFPRPALT